MTANAADFGSAALSAFVRAAGLLALAIGAALAFVFAFFAALVVGVMIAILPDCRSAVGRKIARAVEAQLRVNQFAGRIVCGKKD